MGLWFKRSCLLHCSVPHKLCPEFPQAWHARQITCHSTGRFLCQGIKMLLSWKTHAHAYTHKPCRYAHTIHATQVTAEVADGSKVFHLLGSHGYMSVCCVCVVFVCVCVLCVCCVCVCVVIFVFYCGDVIAHLLTLQYNHNWDKTFWRCQCPKQYIHPSVWRCTTTAIMNANSIHTLLSVPEGDTVTMCSILLNRSNFLTSRSLCTIATFM